MVLLRLELHLFLRLHICENADGDVLFASYVRYLPIRSLIGDGGFGDDWNDVANHENGTWSGAAKAMGCSFISKITIEHEKQYA